MQDAARHADEVIENDEAGGNSSLFWAARPVSVDLAARAQQPALP